MSNHFKYFSTIVLTVALALLASYTRHMRPQPPAPIVIHEVHSEVFQKAFFDASRVYGKAGCGDQALAELTARHAIQSGLSAAVIAAQIAVESGCNPMAISNRGAVGLRQINVKVWNRHYDFTKVNLFNPEDSMTVGDKITVDLVKQYGLYQGLVRYYGGTGPESDGLGGTGDSYARRILTLSGAK